MHIISTPLYISTTRRCNISCSYCHLPKDKRDSYICDERKLLHIVRRLVAEVELNDILYQSVVLHGAECTTLSIETLAELCNLLPKIGLSVSLQSNMIRFADISYTTKFYSMLKYPEYIGIGASIDGPAIINDKSRDGSTRLTAEGIVNIWKVFGKPISFLATINKHTIMHIDAFIRWVYDMERAPCISDMKFRLVEGAGFELSKDEIRVYLKAIHANGFEKYTQTGRMDDATTQGNACEVLEIDEHGDCYACNQAQEELGSFANIFGSSFKSILQKRKMYFYTDKFKLDDECLSCPALDVCHGGCPVFRTESNKAVDCQIKKDYYAKNIKPSDRYIVTVGEEFKDRYKEIALARKKSVIYKWVEAVASLNYIRDDSFNSRGNVNVCGFCVSCVSCVGGCVSMSQIGNELDRAKDTVKNEYDRVEDDYKALANVMSGEYHDDAEDLEEEQKRVQSQIDLYNDKVEGMQEAIDGLFAFHEIFTMARTNLLEAYVSGEQPKIDAAIAGLNTHIADFNNQYSVVKSFSGTFLGKLAISVYMIVGGMWHNATDIATGEANSEDYIQLASAIIIITLAVLTAPATGGMSLQFALAILAAFVSLDAMYAGGVGMSAVMSALDFIFNDVLNLDDRVGSDFGDFDKDSDDYAKMTMYTQLSIQLASITASWKNTAPTIGSELTKGMTGAQTATYQTLYGSYQVAMAAKSYSDANAAAAEIDAKFKKDKEKIDNEIDHLYRKNFIKHYKDVEYFLNDQQYVIDSYLWETTIDNMYTDPYAITPVANIRFSPNDKEKKVSFGFEEMFNYDTMAGGDKYVKKILYNT